VAEQNGFIIFSMTD